MVRGEPHHRFCGRCDAEYTLCPHCDLWTLHSVPLAVVACGSCGGLFHRTSGLAVAGDPRDFASQTEEAGSLASSGGEGPGGEDVPRPTMYRYWHDLYPGAAEVSSFAPIKALKFMLGGFWPRLVGMTRKEWLDYYGPVRPAPGMHTSATGSGTGVWYVLCDQDGRPFLGSTHLRQGLTTEEYASYIASEFIGAEGHLLRV